MHTISVFRDYFVHNATCLRTAQYVALSNIQDFWSYKHRGDPLYSFQDHWTGINNGYIWFNNFNILSKLHIVNSLGIRVVHLELVHLDSESHSMPCIDPCPVNLIETLIIQSYKDINSLRLMMCCLDYSLSHSCQ